MKLFIKVIDGQTVGNPLFEENLMAAFPDGVPEIYEPFERVQPNIVHSVFQYLVGVYVKNTNNIWTDEWSVVEKSDEEKELITQQIKDYVVLNVNARKSDAISKIKELNDLSDTEGVRLWSDYLEKLNNWNLISIEPVTPSIPLPPYKNENEIWEV
jgi:hypothetical protein